MRQRGPTFRVVNSVMAAIFVLGAAVQYNDPDPWRWIAIYGAAAVSCLLDSRLRPGWVAPAAVGVASLVWIAASAPRILPHLVIRDLVRPMQEKTPAIEESRELLGLVIIAVWMGLLAMSWIRRKRERQRDS